MKKLAAAVSICILFGEAHATTPQLRDYDRISYHDTVENRNSNHNRSDNDNHNRNSNANKNSNRNSNANKNSNRNSNANKNSNRNSNANKNSNRNKSSADANSRAHSNASADNRNKNISSNRNTATGGDASSRSSSQGGSSNVRVNSSPTTNLDNNVSNNLSNGSSSTSDASNENTVNASSTNNIDGSSTNTVDASSTNNIDGSSTNTVDNSSLNDASNTSTNDASNDNSTTINGGDTNVNAIALDYDAIDLANLPVAVCQGSSVTASGSGNDGLFGVGLGFGKSNIDDQCTLRENIRSVATLAEYVPQLRKDLLQAVAHLDGFEHMWWDPSQHPKCQKWIKKGSRKAIKHNCKLPNVAYDPTGMQALAPEAPAIQDYVVYFDTDNSTLTPAGMEIVREAAARIRATETRSVEVAAHTDRVASDNYNQKLSQRRAETVRDALIRNGVNASIISTSALGESQPAVITADGVPEALNRRAEVMIILSAQRALAGS